MAVQRRLARTLVSLIWTGATGAVISSILMPATFITFVAEGYSGAEVLAIVVSVFAVCYWLWQRPRLSPSMGRVLLGWAILVIIALSSLGRALEPGIAIKRVLFLFSVLGLIMAFGVIVPKRYALRTIKLLLVVVAILAITGVTHYGLIVSSSNDRQVRASGLARGPNTLAGTLAVSIPLMLALRKADSNRGAMWGTAVVLTSAGVASSLSRGGFYVMCFVVSLYALLCNKRLLIYMLVFGLLFGLLFSGLYARVGEGVKTLAGNAPTTLRQRVQLWAMGLLMFSRHPLWGVGIGNYRYLQNKWIVGFPAIDIGVRDLWTHNSFLWAGAELGILGLLPFCYVLLNIVLMLLGRVLKSCVCATTKALDAGVALMLVAMLTYSMVDDVFLEFTISFTFWALLASYLRLRNETGWSEERDGRV